MDDNETRQDLYQRTRDDLLKRQLSNSENFDRAILTLSSAALALSLTFIKNVVEFDNVQCLWLLITSWVLFVVSIIVTLISFHISQAAIKVQLRYAEQYYLEKNDEFLTKKNTPAAITEWSGYLSASTFVIAVICLVAFISLNIRGKEHPMSEEKSQSKPQQVQEGATVPSMQKVDIGKGANVPNMQAVPKPHEQAGAPVPSMQAVPQSPQNSGGGSGSDGGGQSGGDQSGAGQSGGASTGGE